MARGSFSYHDGDLIGEGFTGGPPSQAAPFAVDIEHHSAWIDSLPKVLRPEGWGVYRGAFLGDAEQRRQQDISFRFMFFPGAAARINAAFAAAFHRV